MLFLKNNKAPILIWSGVAALFGATIASIPMTVKATHAVDKKKKDLNTDKLSMKEYFATIWKYYILKCMHFNTISKYLSKKSIKLKVEKEKNHT